MSSDDDMNPCTMSDDDDDDGMGSLNPCTLSDDDDEEDLGLGPCSPKPSFSVPVCAARALNAAGQSRVTLSLRSKRLSAAC